MHEELELQQLVNQYTEAIHTQNKEDFYSIWSKDDVNTMISNSNKYVGLDNLYNDFLIGGIQNAYTKIDLIIENTHVQKVSDTIAIITLEYHTECIRRETNEEYGIEGLETQIVKKTSDGWKLVYIQYHGTDIEKG